MRTSDMQLEDYHSLVTLHLEEKIKTKELAIDELKSNVSDLEQNVEDLKSVIESKNKMQEEFEEL